MSNRPFRFVHAGDFHLEQPPGGVREVPDHLRELFIESPYWAAERVFETVLAEEVDFLVLSGDLLDPLRTGPRGPLFLVEQFERLAQRGIQVYWAGGRVDSPDAWPAAVPLPENVHIFGRGHVEQFIHLRDDEPLACVMGVSRAGRGVIRTGDFHPAPDGPFSLAVAHGSINPKNLEKRPVDYWALGGRHARSTLPGTSGVAHFPGTPQGRSPAESGPRGCTLVQVDHQRNVRASLVHTDVVRWHNERMMVDQGTGREDLQGQLSRRVQELVDAAPRMDLLIRWTVAGEGPILAQLRGPKLAGELLQWLRSEYGYGPPAAWSLSLDVESTAVLPPKWYEQDTIRGEFLRAVRAAQLDPSLPLEVETYLSERQLAGTLSDIVAISDEATRQSVLREVALLGADLLSGEEPQS
ncbi:MAG: DNA repair exonuclease [Planctomycetes bacterium]|nr:DNA repair exonuclease [Planctomycetota bacterium]